MEVKEDTQHGLWPSATPTHGHNTRQTKWKLPKDICLSRADIVGLCAVIQDLALRSLAHCMIFWVYNKQHRSILCLSKYLSIELFPDFYQNTHPPTTDYNKPNFQLHSDSFPDFILHIFLFPVHQFYIILSTKEKRKRKSFATCLTVW